MQITRQIKLLSVNECWCGRRFKTPAYKAYEAELLYTLPKRHISKDTPLKLEIEAGFSSKNSDLSNIIKPFEDILCKKYGIDDRWNFEINMKKKIVKKGEEYIKFSITDIDN